MRQVLTDVGLPVWRSGDGGEVSVELDLAPAGGYPVALAAREERADIRSLSAVLAPRSVLVVGAGRGSDSVGHAVLRNVIQAGFPGRIVAVNPHATQVCSINYLRSVDELTPSRSTSRCSASLRRRCRRWPSSAGARGARAVGDQLGAVRRARARHGPARCGPPARHADGRATKNCLGIVNTDPAVRLDATFTEPAPVGAVGLVTSSCDRDGETGLARLGLGVSRRCRRGTSTTSVATTCCCAGRAHPLGGAVPGVVRQPAQFLRFARRLAERMPVLTVRSAGSAAGSTSSHGRVGVPAEAESAGQARRRGR